jgi:hypothetical protein
LLKVFGIKVAMDDQLLVEVLQFKLDDLPRKIGDARAFIDDRQKEGSKFPTRFEWRIFSD